MKRIIFLFICFISVSVACYAQGSVSHTYISAQQAANLLCSGGIHPFNATFTGGSGQLISFYNGGSTLPMSSGIAITTGDADFVSTQQTGDAGSQSTSTGDTPDDPDLAALESGNQIGAAFLEFDAHIESFPIFMDYSFASEEYNAYSQSSYSDVMGIFITGPGIAGTLNLAKVGSSHVSVPTVNACVNSSSYINNCSVNQNCVTTRPQDPCPFPSVGDHDFPYNGLTKLLTGSFISTNCNNTYVYHVKIAIANIADSNLDSGVFLKQGGFSCTNVGGSLVAQPSPVCDGTNLTLTYNYNPNSQNVLNINWSTGQTGTATSVITAADISNPVYSATVTAGACTEVYTLSVNVNTNLNIAPYVNGVANTGDYVIYEQQNQNTCVSIPSFDTPGEVVIIGSPYTPYGTSFIGNNDPQAIGTFCYSANTGQVGEYTFDVNTTDKNACYSLNSISTFTVVTICSSCYVDVYYQNRRPGNNPLPPYTKVGRSIVAGYDVDPNNPVGNVDTGTNPVEFKSSHIITMSPGFTGGPGYWAHIDPNTCINDCNDCCDHFTGFTVDPIANVVTPNGDGVNDIWQVTDFNHQLCAFNASHFDLIIKDRSGATIMTSSGGNGSSCCQFVSPGPSGGSGILSPIHWAALGVGDGTYFYVLTLSGCGQSLDEIGRIVERFCASLDKANYEIEAIDLSAIKQNEIGVFCSYVKNDLNIKSYNKHCAIMKAFFNWCIKIKDCEVKNPFEKMTLSIAKHKQKTAIEQHEFQKLLESITYENGDAVLKGGKKINHFHSWLHIAFRLALETGLRAEEVVTLNFKDICELHKGVMAFKITNLKVWRIKTGGDPEQISDYTKCVPITASLRKLLLECGMLSYLGNDKTIIPFPSDLNLSYVQDIISRSFSHFVKFAANRKIEYKDLRKTYITRISMVMGNKTKFFTGHSNDAVLHDHYLADEALMGGFNRLKYF